MANHSLHRPLLWLYPVSHSLRLLSTTPSSFLPETQSTKTTRYTPPQPAPNRNFDNSSLNNLMADPQRPRLSRPPSKLAQETESLLRSADLFRHSHRRFRPGDIYSPHDLSPVEQSKWQKHHRSLSPSHISQKDTFDILNIHPLSEFKNPSIMAEFMSSMGRIKGRRETGLRGVNQRRMARAVRRSVGMGFMPSVHRHPEMLEQEAKQGAKKRMGIGRGTEALRGPNGLFRRTV